MTEAPKKPDPVAAAKRLRKAEASFAKHPNQETAVAVQSARRKHAGAVRASLTLHENGAFENGTPETD